MMRRIGFALAFAAVCAGSAWSQSAQAGSTKLEFEVATVRISNGFHQGSAVFGRRGQRSLNNMPLKECIKLAFGVEDYSLEGPSWMDSVPLDIVAKPPAGSLPSQFNQMLQTLLIERFQMKLHHEQKTVEGYALVQGKGGIRIRPVVEHEAGGQGASGSSDGLLWGNGLTAGQLAQMIARQLKRPVEDHTGVTSSFDFRLQWTPDRAAAPAPQSGTAWPAGAAQVPTFGPSSLFTALEEQLGLELKKDKVQVDILVIDHVERVPLEN